MPLSYNTDSPDTLEMLLNKVQAIQVVNGESLAHIESRRGEKVITNRHYTLEPKQPSPSISSSSYNEKMTKTSRINIKSENDTNNNNHKNQLSIKKRKRKEHCDYREKIKDGFECKVNDKNLHNQDQEDENNDMEPPLLEIVDQKTTKSVDEIIKSWKYNGEALRKETIAFHQFIDTRLKNFDDLKRLHHEYEDLIEKYSRILMDEIESRKAVEGLLHNVECLQVAIGEIHTQLLDVKDYIEGNVMLTSGITSISKGLKILETNLPTIHLNLHGVINGVGKERRIPEFENLSLLSCKDVLHLRGHSEKMEPYEFNGCQHLACSTEDSKHIKLWDLTNKRIVATLNSKNTIRALVYYQEPSNIGKPMLASASKFDIELWDLTTKSIIATLSSHTEIIEALVVFQNENGKQMLVSGSRDDKINVWDLDHPYGLISTLEGHTEDVIALSVFYRDFKPYLASGSEDCTIKIWCLSSYVLVTNFICDAGIVCLRVVNYNRKKILISGNMAGLIKLWNLENHSCLASFKAHPNWAISSLEVIRSNGQLYLVTGSDYDLAASYNESDMETGKTNLKIWNLENTSIQKELQIDFVITTMKVFDHKGPCLAIGGWGRGEIQLWMN